MSMPTAPKDRYAWHLTWHAVMEKMDTIKEGDVIMLTNKEYEGMKKGGTTIRKTLTMWTVERKYDRFMTVYKQGRSGRVRTAVNYIGYFLEGSGYSV